MAGEIGVKTVIYNTKRDKKEEKGEKGERKRWKKYNSKRKEFCTLDLTTRTWPMILSGLVHVQLFPFINTIFQYLFLRFRLTFSPTLYKFIVRVFWAWVHSYFGFKSKSALTCHNKLDSFNKYKSTFHAHLHAQKYIYVPFIFFCDFIFYQL